MTTDKWIDIPRLVRETVKGIGYTRAKYGFDAETCGVVVAIDEQSPTSRRASTTRTRSSTIRATTIRSTRSARATRV